MSSMPKLFFQMGVLCLFMSLQACNQQKQDKPEEAKKKPASTSIYSREGLDKIEKDVNKAMQQSVDRVNSALDGK